MGRYHNPPESIREVGRKIYPMSEANAYSSLVSQLKSGEVLVGLYDRGMFKNAPLLYSEAEYNEFHNQYAKGHLLTEEFFATTAFDG